MVEEKKSSMPLLTVLMPVYNAEKFLAESIDSILNQTYVDFEMLILDDASTDNSLKIIKAYAKEDKRIKILVNKTNQRQAKCRNSLLKKTKTEFIAWMDADDISSSHWLQTQMDFLKKNPKIDVVSCHLKFFENLEFILKRPLLDLQIKSAFLLDCAFGTGGSMMKMKKIRANKLFFNEQLESAEDYDYWIKSCSVLSFAAVDEVLYNYRIHNIQESKTNKEKQRKAHLLCSQKHLLQFNIKTDSETIRIFLNWDIKEVDSKKFQEAVNVLDKVFSLKNFYGYSGVNKPTLIFYYLNLVKGLLYRRLLKKNLKKVKKFLKNIPEEYSAITPSFILNEIYYQYKKIGLKGELLFIKDFGFFDGFKPFLTVLMPVYNAEKFLAESIGSVLKQTYYNFELLILDDASTDNSLKIIKAYAKEDKRIKVLVNKTNQKQAKCRNLLLKTSKTEFIAWMDADDISLEDRLQTQMDFLKQNPKIDAVGVQYSAFGSSGNLPANFTSHFSLSDLEIKTNFIFGYDFLFGASLMRMEKIKQHNIFFDNNYKLSTGEDHQYIIDCFPFMKFANLDKVLYQYRQDSKQTTVINQKQILDNSSVIIRKHLLSFNIKADSETIKMFLKWNNERVDSQASQKFQEAVRVFEEILTIKDFYGYSDIKKSPLIAYFITMLSYLRYSGLLKKNREIFKKIFEAVSRESSVTCSRMFLKKIYCSYCDTGLEGKSFFIKDFGFLDDFKPLLTVLMPVHNAEKFLAESINSILSQTYSNFEFVILDDGSTDNSLKIIEAYAKEDKRIKVIVNQKNRGEAKCRNRLLKNSKTEFIAWMDADDISLEDRLQTQMDFLKQNPKIDAVGVQYSAFGSSGNLATNFTSRCSLSDLEIKTNFIFGYDFFLPASLIRMKKIKLHHLFFDIHYKLSTGVDQQYIIDCFPFMKFANIDRVLYQYRQHAHQIMKVNQKQILDNSSVIIRKHLLSFNIKTDLETIKMFFKWNDEKFDSQASQKFQEAVRVFEEIFSIKDFYGYSCIEKSAILPYYLNLLRYLCRNRLFKKNRKISKELFKDLLKKYSASSPIFALTEIYRTYKITGLKGKLFFLKDYGLKNYLRVKKW